MSYTELGSGVRKARKDYRCMWCNQIINKDEHYSWRTYIYEGDFHGGEKMHIECFKAMSSGFDSNEDDGSFMPGEYIRGSTELR